MKPRSIALTLALALFLAAPSIFFSAASSLPPSHSPSPAPSLSPPKHLMADPIGLRRPPPGNDLHYPSPHRIQGRQQPHEKGGIRPPPPQPGETKLNLGKKIGLTFAGVAIFLQVVFGGFLVFKRYQLKKVDEGLVDRGADSSSASDG